MKRSIKILGVIALAGNVAVLLVKKESFLEAHYDTAERRNIDRTTILGIEISESVAWIKDGYRDEYREIFGVEP